MSTDLEQRVADAMLPVFCLERGCGCCSYQSDQKSCQLLARAAIAAVFDALEGPTPERSAALGAMIEAYDAYCERSGKPPIDGYAFTLMLERALTALKGEL